jgi:hypothetical protein
MGDGLETVLFVQRMKYAAFGFRACPNQRNR